MTAVRMRALRTWRNDDHEGFVQPGREFDVSELRARDLETQQLATRVHTSPRVIVREDAPVVVTRPLPSSSAAAPPPPTKTSRKPAAKHA